jgi:hypothetical protein
MMMRERGGYYLLLLRGFLVRMGPRNPVSAGVTLRMRTSSSSSSGIGSGRSTTLRWGEGVAARLLPDCRSREQERERER